MANTYTALYYHIVFSTKRRERWLTEDLQERVWSYMGGIARENKMTALQIGGIEDHVHVLLGAPPTIAPSKVRIMACLLEPVDSGTSAIA